MLQITYLFLHHEYTTIILKIKMWDTPSSIVLNSPAQEEASSL